MSYPKAEGNIPKFLCYLLEKDVIKNYKLNKNEARNIFNDEFKPKYELNGFSFSNMFSYLRYFQVMRYDKNTETMIFKADILNSITPETSFIKRKSFSLVKVIKEQQNTKIDPSIIDLTSSFGVQQKKEKNQYKECFICNYVCSNAKTFKHHKNSDKHKFKELYISKIKNSTGTHLDIFAEVNAGYGNKPEAVVLRLGNSTITGVTLTLSNKTKFEFDIVEFIIINETNYVNLQQLELPQLFKAESSFTLRIEILFRESIYWRYPIIYKLKNRENGMEIEIIKELVINVYSEVVQDLLPTTPYNKLTFRNRSIQAPNKIIHGIHPHKAENDFNPEFKLQQFSMPHNIITLLNANLKEFEGITVQQQNVLNDIRKLFIEYKQHNTFIKDRYYNMLELLLYLEEYQMWRNIRKYDADNQILTYTTIDVNQFLELNIPGLTEHRPSLLRGDSVLISEQKKDDVKYEGVVHYVKKDSVLLRFCSGFTEKARRENDKYSVSFTFNRVTLRAEHQAITLLRKHNAINILFKSKISSKKVLENRDIKWFNPHIKDNIMQQTAVLHVLSKTSFPMPYLIFGPPGTGKTVTIVEAILQIWSSELKEKVLVCAPSNNAANEITKRLIENIPCEDLFRYIGPSFPQTLIDKEILSYTNLKQNEYYHPSIKQVQNYRIVITTLVTASRIVNSNIPNHHFAYVFIDESCKATESETLIPIAGILTSEKTLGAMNGQIVLAGDPRQLGPIIHSSLAETYGFGISMLERLMNTDSLYEKNEDNQYDNKLVTKLVKSYRSHPSIMELSNKLFYDNKLESVGDNKITHTFVDWKELPNPNFPIIFHSVLGKDEQEGTSPSFFNLQEIDVIINYLEKLINQDINGIRITEEDIGIITPYRKQTEKLRKALAKKNWENLMVGSVENFQGKEKLIIIISTIRSKPEFVEKDIKYHLGFLKNPKRFNVALTRAQALLIVVGNPLILQYDSYWGAFIRYCKHNKACIGTPFQLRNTYGQFEIDALVAQLSLEKPSTIPVIKSIVEEDNKEIKENIIFNFNQDAAVDEDHLMASLLVEDDNTITEDCPDFSRGNI